MFCLSSSETSDFKIVHECPGWLWYGQNKVSDPQLHTSDISGIYGQIFASLGGNVILNWNENTE